MTRYPTLESTPSSEDRKTVLTKFKGFKSRLVFEIKRAVAWVSRLPVIERPINWLVMLHFGADAIVDDDPARDCFIERCRSMKSPRVLEIGAKHYYTPCCDSWVPNAGEYLGTDIETGKGVDLVADVHRLTETTGEEQFDAIISQVSFEHFKYPFLAAHEIMKALRIGGVLYVHTVQTFPLHYAPGDYFRFSREALAALFGTQMGFRVVKTNYKFPSKVYAPYNPGCRKGVSFLSVALYGEKIGKTPDTYVHDLE